MRSPAFSYRLGFALPADFVVTDGGPQPSPAGCTLQSFKNMVVITGPSRDAVFEKATELLRAIRAMTRQPMSITADLETPGPVPRRDSWTIVVGADVAFTPTGLDPYFPRAAE